MIDQRHLESIARRHRITPLSRAVEALGEAFAGGVEAARKPLDPQKPGRKRYGATRAEADVLATVIRWRRDGWTWQAAADGLNDLGARRRNGSPWTASAIAGVCEGLG